MTHANSDTHFELRRPDALSSFVELLQIERLLLANVSLGEPWRISNRERHPVLHFVKRGKLRVFADGEPTEVSAGDSVMFTQGDNYSLGSGATVPEIPFDLDVANTECCTIEVGGEGPVTEIFCCAYRLSSITTPLLSFLPPLVICRNQGEGAVERTIYELFAERGKRGEAGQAGIVLRLSKILLLSMLRTEISTKKQVSAGLLAAAAEPALARALAAVHNDLGGDWSVAKLAGVAAMSRTAFSALFHEKLGIPPKRYVHQCRMSEAVRLLCNSKLNLSEIGHKLGYNDPTSFSRAFRREVGVSPREFRSERELSG